MSALDAIDLAEAGAVRPDASGPLQDDAHALDSLAGGVFVGRHREMGELKACLEDALSGRGRLNQYQGGMCIAGVLTTTERTPRHFILPLGPN